MRFDLPLQQVEEKVLRCWILRFFKYHEFITHWKVTHVAQNINYNEGIIQDFTQYINRQIVAGRHTAELILSMVETNVDFDRAARRTLSQCGERSISGRITDHSGRCTVMLGVTMSGVKLPAFVIWKGVPNGRVWLEVWGVQFPRDMVKHTVQPRGWMDSSTYKQWVAEVVAPY